jgi:phosphoribosylamine--glycine ligase
MKVLLVGSGGREHALAWKLAQSPRLDSLLVAPGNAGTARLKSPRARIANVAIRTEDKAGLVQFATREKIDLAVVGPEAPLADGLADDLRAAGIPAFGPSQAAAQIEASKPFAKAFMARHGIPTARFAVFQSLDPALAHLRAAEYPVVIKASGLTAGKGVIVPRDAEEAEAALRRMMEAREFGAAGDEVVIEERLEGPEVSLFAFTDGTTTRITLPAQDHKRVFDGDRGPNTGGMGAYAPVPVCPPAIVEEVRRTILQPAIDGLRAEGRPFAGILYGGLMLTAAGPMVIEFNCRFGDPEAQVILPLLDSDLLPIALACATGALAGEDVRWKAGAAACVAIASGGYPGKYATGLPISGLEENRPNSFVFHAGTREQDGCVVTAGGRVLCVTGWGGDIPQAIQSAYAAVEPIRFEGMHFRKDIGHRALGAEGRLPA